MVISVYIAAGCPSRAEVLANLGQALAAAGASDEGYHLMDEDEARRLGLHQSPTVLVDGEDIEKGTVAGEGDG